MLGGAATHALPATTLRGAAAFSYFLSHFLILSIFLFFFISFLEKQSVLEDSGCSQS